MWVSVVHLLVLSASFAVARPASDHDEQAAFNVQPTKRIAIVGAGAAGIATLKAIMDLEEEIRRGWSIVAFEERSGVGGVWLPDTQPVPSPPEIPETPLYDNLQTNGPHPMLPIPNTTLPPETELAAPHHRVLQYHESVVRDFTLAPYIKTEHSVVEARWIGSSTEGVWDVLVENRQESKVLRQTFDHLVVATGVNRFPRYAHFEGEEEWRAANRTLMHSMYYRRSEAFAGQNVVVVGGGPSGWDISTRLVGYTNSTWWSRNTRDVSIGLPVAEGVHGVPRIASVATNGTVRFVDGAEAHDVHTIILATGYEWRVPFLTAGGMLDEIPDGTNASSHRLTTNSRYLRPVYERTLSLDPSYPLGALYFNGFMTYNPTGMCNYAQGLFAAYTMAYPELLDSREELHAALLHREECVRADNYDPLLHSGHWVAGYIRVCERTIFEDLLIQYLQRRGLAGRTGVPPLGVNYTEPWRAWTYDHAFDLLMAWKKGIEPRGKAYVQQWVEGRATEQDWVAMMRELAEWWDERKPESSRGLVSGSWFGF